MKRQWKAWRVLLALLVLGIGGYFVYMRPVSPLWTVPYDMAKDNLTLLQVDEQKRIVYVRYDHFESWRSRGEQLSEFRGYDLRTGQLVWRHPDLPPTSNNSEIWNPIIWKYIVSPDLTLIVSAGHAEESVVIRAFPSFELLHQIKIPNHDRDLSHVEFSHDSKRLLIINKKGAYILDAHTAKWQDQFDMTQLPAATPFPTDMSSHVSDKPSTAVGTAVYTHSTGTFLETHGCMALSPDGCYLAVPSADPQGTVVFHVPCRRVIARWQFSGLPRFSASGNRLVIVNQNLARNSLLHQPQWFQLSETGAVPIPRNSEDIDGVPVYCHSDKLIVLHLDPASFKRPVWMEWDWVPEWARMKLIEMLGYGTLQADLTVHQLATNEVTLRTNYSIDAMKMMGFYPRGSALVSNGEIFLFNTGLALEAWNLPPRRPASVWYVLLAMALASIWIAYPRRRKATSAPAASHTGA